MTKRKSLDLVSVLLLGFCFSDAELVDFTCVNENPVLSLDTPSNVIASYKGNDTLRATEVAFGRTVFTGTGNNLSPCPCLVSQVLAGESLITRQQMQCPSSACQCNEDSTCLYRIGAFFCQIEGAAQTKITTVTLKSNATIRPERQTITVNRGESVTLNITTSSPKSEFRWRKNTKFISDWKDVQSPNIRNVTVNQSGLYECHEPKLRPKGQHAIFKLIVRGCPANKWGSSTGCHGVCPVCYNGGMCDDQTGQCICAPGFSGSSCHIVHGRNVFGLSGTLRCNESEGRHATSCRGRLFCLQDPFGCVCAAGYKGLDCKQECDQPNTFGPYCSQTCHCADDIQCLTDTGECNDPSCNHDVDGYCPQHCADGWKGNNCQVATPCRAGFYGDLCLKRCNCRDNEPCHEDTGVCGNGCPDGYIGPTCSQDGTTTIVSFSQTNKPIAGQTVFVECVVVGNPLPISSDITVVDSLRNPSVALHFTQESPEINAYRRTNQYYVPGGASRDGTQLTCHVNGPTPISQELTLYVFEPPSLVSAPTSGAVTSTSITVRWRLWKQSQDRGDGPVLRYEVHYRLKSDLDDAEYSDNKTAMTNTSTSLVVTGLVPGTEYDFVIVVVGDPWGSGRPSPKAKFRTSCQAPGPVDIQSLKGTSYDNLNVSWSAPTENNCPVERYIISHTLTKLKACDSVPPTLSTTISQNTSSDVTTVSLNNLKAYSEYRVSVVAVNDAGRSPEQVQIKNRGGKAAPSFTPTVTVPQSDITSSSIRLTWTAVPCEELNGVFSHYRILLTNPATMEQTQFDVSGLEETASQLHVTACTTYSIQVAVVNDVGVGRYSIGTRVTTETAVPGRVEHLTTNAFNGYPTILQVHWARPPGNCPIQFYTISYRLMSRLQCPTTVTSRTIESGMETGTAYNIIGLEPYSTYDVHVTATAAAGVGSGASVGGQTAEAAPSKPPQSINVTDIRKKGLSFSWESPPCWRRHGVIIGYSYILEDQERDVENITGETNGHETSITLNNLVPYTLYSFQVRARTAAGDGPYSEAVMTQTLQAKPPPVSSITTPSADASSITVQWQRPDPPHGIITAYHMVYFIVGQDSDSTTVDITEGLNQTVVRLTLTGLQADSNYSIQVQAETINVGDPSQPVYRVTQEAFPGEPSALAVSRKEERELLVVWDVPTEPNGVIVGYTVKHRVTARPYDPDFAPSSQYETSSLLDPGIRSRTITGLDPATKYEILVSASTQKGEGARGVIEVFTEPASDIPTPETPTMNPKMSTESSVVISIPEVINRFVVSYLVTVKKISKRQRRQSMLKVQDEDFGSFNETPESYVAGEIEKHSHTGTFEIGNNKTYGGYYNPPLQEGTTYEVRSGASSKTDGAPQVSWSEPLTFKAGKIQESPPSDQDNDVEGSSSAGTTIGVILALLVCIIVIIGALTIIKRRRNQMTGKTCESFGLSKLEQASQNKKKAPAANLKHAASEDALTNLNAGQSDKSAGVATLPADLHKKPTVKAKKKTPTGPIKVEKLAAYVKSKKANNNEGYKQDYGSLPSDMCHPWEIAAKEENKTKNRYGNIIAYDHSRVVLEKLEGAPHSDYINASYIDGYKHPKRYIASQGPNTASMVDMWRMIWQERTQIIVMVTHLVEGGKKKCEQYWPSKIKRYGVIEVTLESESKHADYIIRNLKVTKDEECRRLVQYHFISWPDMGLPQCSGPLLHFIGIVKEGYTTFPDMGPVIVHCSAGVGRTGSFITIDSMLEKAEAEGQVDVFQFVSDMRNRRVRMVQTLDQYVFIFDVLLEAFLCGQTGIRLEELGKAINRLKSPSNKGKGTWMDEEFAKLAIVQPTPQRGECSRGAKDPNNVNKNRFQDNLPLDRGRPYLMTMGTEQSTNYINASFVNGYWKQDRYIITQIPMPNTTIDFWSLIHDYNSSTIIMLNPLDPNDQTMDKYWPDKTSAYGPFNVQLTETESYDDTVCRTLMLDNMNKPKDDACIIKQFEFQGWPIDADIPSSISGLLKMINNVERWLEESPEGPITIQCSDGVRCSGLFCAILFMLDRMKTEKTVDVFQTVRSVRTNRPSAVTSAEQYKLCYETAKTHLDSFDIYENFR